MQGPLPPPVATTPVGRHARRLASLVVSPRLNHSWRSMVRHTHVAIAILLLGGACTSPSPTLRADTKAYLAKMASWAPIEAETARTLDRIIATQFVDQAEVLRQLADSAPRVQHHLVEVEQYHPRTPEIRRIHEAYIDGWRDLLQGYAFIEGGLLGGDQARLSRGRESLLHWRQSIVLVARSLGGLSDEPGGGADPAPARPSGQGRTNENGPDLSIEKPGPNHNN
jgi:hypothetical protein